MNKYVTRTGRDTSGTIKKMKLYSVTLAVYLCDKQFFLLCTLAHMNNKQNAKWY